MYAARCVEVVCLNSFSEMSSLAAHVVMAIFCTESSAEDGNSISSQSTHTVESVQDLLKMLSGIGNWEALCTSLGVRQAVMSELIYSSLVPSIKKKRCLESYFNSGHAHWEEVIIAVVGPGIFNERVAKKIADRYLLNYKAIVDKYEL